VVTTKNVVHAALYLVAVLAGVGAIYILLIAEFVAAVQILVYVGAIVVLFLFGVMLTRARVGHDAELDGDQRGIALVTALFLAGILGYVVVDAFGDKQLPRLEGSAEAITATRGTGAVGDAIFSTYLVPFEVVSVLLLAALVGAIVLARKD
jgi:NADH-quinone oxidoreductase subunit J